MNRRILIAALVCIVVLAAAALGTWVWLSREGPRPMVEVIAAEAPIKIGEETIATAKQGDQLAVYDRRTGWYQVRVKRQLGWIYAAHVRRVRAPDAAPRLVEAEILGVYFPDDVLGEFPRPGERWALVEVHALAAKANVAGGTAIATNRFVLTLGKTHFYRPRVWKTISVGDHTVDRLEVRDEFVLPVGQARKLRLAYSIPSDVVTRAGWRIVYVRPKAKGGAKTPGTAGAAE